MTNYCPRCGDILNGIEMCEKCQLQSIVADTRAAFESTSSKLNVPNAFIRAMAQNNGMNSSSELDGELETANALYNFLPQDPATQLALKKNDYMIIIRKDPDGWWLVQKGNERGLVPGAYVRVNPPSPPKSVAALQASNERINSIQAQEQSNSVNENTVSNTTEKEKQLETPLEVSNRLLEQRNKDTKRQVQRLKKCSVCNETVVGPKRIINDDIYHHTCLTCGECRNPIEDDENIVILRKKAFHDDCAEDVQFCHACHNQIVGRKYKLQDKFFHRKCFTCTTCQLELSEETSHFKDSIAVCKVCFESKPTPSILVHEDNDEFHDAIDAKDVPITTDIGDEDNMSEFQEAQSGVNDVELSKKSHTAQTNRKFSDDATNSKQSIPDIEVNILADTVVPKIKDLNITANIKPVAQNVVVDLTETTVKNEESLRPSTVQEAPVGISPSSTSKSKATTTERISTSSKASDAKSDTESVSTSSTASAKAIISVVNSTGINETEPERQPITISATDLNVVKDTSINSDDDISSCSDDIRVSQVFDADTFNYYDDNDEMLSPMSRSSRSSSINSMFNLSARNLELRLSNLKEEQEEPIDKSDSVTRVEKCSKCENGIDGIAIQALGGFFHTECFQCFHCEKPIDDDEGYAEKNMKAYHGDCYRQKYSKKCSSCKKLLTGKVVKALDYLFHPECFKCSVCAITLSGCFFETDKNEIVCEHCKYNSDLPILCHATAGYPFTASDTSQLNLEVGDAMDVLQKDADGWWLVVFNGVRGFVPGSYLITHPPIPEKARVKSNCIIDTSTKHIINLKLQTSISDSNSAANNENKSQNTKPTSAILAKSTSNTNNEQTHASSNNVTTQETIKPAMEKIRSSSTVQNGSESQSNSSSTKPSSVQSNLLSKVSSKPELTKKPSKGDVIFETPKAAANKGRSTSPVSENTKKVDNELSVEKTSKTSCKKCTYQNPLVARFCGKCGNNLTLQ